MKQKVFIASRSVVNIAHRALDSYEARNPMYIRGTACDTWAEAKAALIERYERMERLAKRDLKHAQNGLAKARALQEPKP